MKKRKLNRLMEIIEQMKNKEELTFPELENNEEVENSGDDSLGICAGGVSK